MPRLNEKSKETAPTAPVVSSEERIIEVTLRIPVFVNKQLSAALVAGTHIDMTSFGDGSPGGFGFENATAFHGVREALMAGSAKLRSGRAVANGNDAIRWLFEQVAIACKTGS